MILYYLIYRIRNYVQARAFWRNGSYAPANGWIQFSKKIQFKCFTFCRLERFYDAEMWYCYND